MEALEETFEELEQGRKIISLYKIVQFMQIMSIATNYFPLVQG